MKIKKMLAAVLSAIMVLSLAACGESEKSGSSVTSGNVTEATTTAETTTQETTEEKTKSTAKAEEKQTSKTSAETKASTAKTTTKAAAKASKKCAGIDPKFKEAMDSYEAFFDEYVEFMKKYSDPNNTDVMSMLTDYSNYMQKYADTMNKLNEIDENSLNAAEAAYYTKVMARITAKLAEVSQ